MTEPKEQPKEQPKDKPFGRFSIFNEIYVDFLGSLIPGLFTVISAGSVIFVSLVSIYIAKFTLGTANESQAAYKHLTDIITGFHWEIATVTAVASYVIGTTFFRQDPKKPDSYSAFYVWMNSKKNEKHGLAVQNLKSIQKLEPKTDEDKLFWRNRIWPILQTKNYIKKLGMDTQFPYLYLKCYLAARGLTHLIPCIPWCPLEIATKGFRTKMFINILKIRVQSLAPALSRDIVRNEAHVRLAISVWYAITLLKWISIVNLCVVVISFYFFIENKFAMAYAPICLTIILLILSLLMKHYLRKCIHYMRVREVIYVLENSKLADALYEGRIFKGLLHEEQGQISCVDCPRLKSSSV